MKTNSFDKVIQQRYVKRKTRGFTMKTALKIIFISILLGLTSNLWAHKGSIRNHIICPKGKIWAPALHRCLSQKQWDEIKHDSPCPKGQNLNNGKCVNPI